MLVHLDFNFKNPQSTHPNLVPEKKTDILSWRKRFGEYEKIKVFALDDKHQFDHSLHASRLKFAKKCISKADELQNDPSRKRLVPDELAMLQEEE